MSDETTETPNDDLQAQFDKQKSEWEEKFNSLQQERDSFQKAMHEERGKRQALQEQYAQQPQPIQEFDWGNPEQYFATQFDSLKSDFERRNQERDIKSSIRLAKIQHKDFDDAHKAFLEMANTNPQIAQTAISQGDEAGEYMYRTGKAALIEKNGGMDAEIERRAKEIAEEQIKQQLNGAFPTDMLGEQSGINGQGASAMPSLEDLFKAS